MIFEFTKMSGAGNDFILADNRSGVLHLTRDQVARLCHRQFGVGADGLMLLTPAKGAGADFAWQFWNSDGSDAEMCGNGARCFARYIRRATGWEPPRVSFETAAGVIEAEYHGERVTVTLTPPKDLVLNRRVETSAGALEVHSLNTGVPHAVVYVADADSAMVGQLGAELRWHKAFAPRGTNVNFVQVTGPDAIKVRTYERGVEGETLACGTGLSAAALISAKVHGFASPVRVRVRGGDDLEVSFSECNGAFGSVRLNGPADFVFEGRADLRS